ncbi:mitochondrial carrier homolog 2-like [Clytia hemisphaerica]|uniref:Mitochondrial carrier protein n=1 Tax=Clytia hemisphaerica TaxID=252671 RepID=A0A7M6DMJ3_9CNID
MADESDISQKAKNTVARIKTSFVGGLAISVGLKAVAHPLTYIKVLIQVGHEPIAPVKTTTLFGKTVYRLPNFIQYGKHIKRVDGWLGLYRGLGPRLVSDFIGSTVNNAVTTKLNVSKDEEPDKSPGTFIRETGQLTIAKTCSIVVSYPFHVISIRMMVQFVGRETYYNNIFSSIQEIYNEEGISGFFSGVVPFLIGELVALWISRTISYLIRKQLPHEEASRDEVKSYSSQLSGFIASMVTYPFHLVNTLLAVNDTRLVAGNPPLMPIYESWTDCWVELGKKGLRHRGSSLFRRNVKI